ncbi:Gamma-interferon-inducible lysosomal thiol reductase [Micractinium conductrix]|uniref:Gamma-interferon-inducible lysosomal thiol reductase n=1 Tax=Micractinium conductrix TaxID=554055 RepID=A0A2P6VLK8_9CHLO|nr:Gamma-interferon-inducible lysosomal thiol reductase [Micractinium conductrix]|eukprot:PSC74983.1 Gamma-interferon-inducible lysosomal thiol reductase [Micractinium conductrix]
MLSHHGHHKPWYAKRKVQGAAIAGAGCCLLLVFVMAGPRPLINDGLVDGPTTTAAGAGVQQSGDALAATQKGGAVGAAAAAGRSKVRVDFYGESLCPDCQHMVRDVLEPMFETGVAAVMDLRYVAFGNVRNNSDGTFAYQHGPAEGKYNRHILCAQHRHPGQDEWFPYVKCLADNMRALDSKATGCAEERGWDTAQIGGCAEGEEGKGLEQAAAEATWALHPKHNFVPWMVVNGAPIGALYDQLQMFVCAASPVEGRPEACYSLPERMQHQGR